MNSELKEGHLYRHVTGGPVLVCTFVNLDYCSTFKYWSSKGDHFITASLKAFEVRPYDHDEKVPF